MEDLFAQKDVGFSWRLWSLYRVSCSFLMVFVCSDGGGGAEELDGQASGATAGLQSGFCSAAADCSGVTGDEETESVWDVAVLERQVRVSTIKYDVVKGIIMTWQQLSARYIIQQERNDPCTESLLDSHIRSASSSKSNHSLIPRTECRTSVISVENQIRSGDQMRSGEMGRDQMMGQSHR